MRENERWKRLRKKNRKGYVDEMKRDGMTLLKEYNSNFSNVLSQHKSILLLSKLKKYACH